MFRSNSTGVSTSARRPIEETGRHLRCLDGWRGCAIGLVLAGHFFFEARLPQLGTVGVQLFFVLSGRLMAEILFVRQAGLARFYVRRVSRVVPALVVFVLVCGVVFARAGGGYPVGIKGIVTALTFTINYAMLYSHTILLFDHLWSLCVEEHSYVVLSLIAVAARRNWASTKAVLAAIWLMATLNGVIQADILGKEPLEILWRTDVSIAMIAVSALFHLHAPHLRIPASLCAPAFLLGIFFAMQTSSFLVSFGLGSLCLAIAVSIVDERSVVIGPLLSNEMLGRLGRFSFSLYLWQQPFFKLCRYGAAPVIVLFPAMILVSMASFYLVEKPARRFINQAFDRRRRPAFQ